MTKQTPIYTTAQQLGAEFNEVAGWQVAQTFGNPKEETAVLHRAVALGDQSHNGKIRLEGLNAAALLQAEELALNGGQKTAQGWVYRLRPDLFFLHTAPGAVDKTAVALTGQAAAYPDLITVTDVTHGRSELWLLGPSAAELLSRLCGLDFHDTQFANHTARPSSVAKTRQLIIRRDQNGILAYALIGGRSLAVYLWTTILEAGADLGVQPVGLAALKTTAAP